MFKIEQLVIIMFITNLLQKEVTIGQFEWIITLRPHNHIAEYTCTYTLQLRKLRPGRSVNTKITHSE